MVILCDLAWKGGDEEEEDGNNGLRPQIAIMIKKQLDNRSDLLKKKGAIGKTYVNYRRDAPDTVFAG
jgi:hypothetical protein